MRLWKWQWITSDINNDSNLMVNFIWHHRLNSLGAQRIHRQLSRAKSIHYDITWNSLSGLNHQYNLLFTINRNSFLLGIHDDLKFIFNLILRVYQPIGSMFAKTNQSSFYFWSNLGRWFRPKNRIDLISAVLEIYFLERGHVLAKIGWYTLKLGIHYHTEFIITWNPLFLLCYYLPFIIT